MLVNTSNLAKGCLRIAFLRMRPKDCIRLNRPPVNRTPARTHEPGRTSRDDKPAPAQGQRGSQLEWSSVFGAIDTASGTFPAIPFGVPHALHGA